MNLLGTYSGTRININKNYDGLMLGEVNLEDVVHGLALQCRFAGQLGRFYSVAQHSVILSKLFFEEDYPLYALLHDADEAYLPDIPRPWKDEFPEFNKLGARVRRWVLRSIGLEGSIPKEIEEMDRDIAHAEAHYIGPATTNWVEPAKAAFFDPSLFERIWTPEEAIIEYRRALKEALLEHKLKAPRKGDVPF